MQALLGRRDRRFNLLGTLALLARRPVEPAQAVQDRAADLVFGVGFQLYVVTRIEAVDGGNQAQRPGGDQVVQVDAFRQSLVNPPGDQTDLRQMFENQAFAFFGRAVARLVFL